MSLALNMPRAWKLARRWAVEDKRSNAEREQTETNGIERESVVSESVSYLPAEDKAEITRMVLEDLPMETKVRIASETAEQLPPEERDKLVRGLQALSPQERKEIVGLLLPEQRTTNWIWLIIVGSFSFVMILSVVALCAAVLWQASGEIQILLTVVTTIAGLLAGFISGRASTGNTPA